MNEDIEQLKRDVEELKLWKEQRIRQLIPVSLDETSQRILSKYFLSYAGFFITSGGASGNAFANMLVKQDGRISAVSIYNGLISCTPNSSTDRYTLNSDLTTNGQGVLSNDQFVTVFSPDPGDTPAGINNGDGYFIVNTSGNTVQLSLTKGGVPINFTTNGTGPQYIIF